MTTTSDTAERVKAAIGQVMLAESEAGGSNIEIFRGLVLALGHQLSALSPSDAASWLRQQAAIIEITGQESVQ